MSTESIEHPRPCLRTDEFLLSKDLYRAVKREIHSNRARRNRNEASRTPDGSKAWSTLSHRLQEFDASTIGSYKEDIDTLLVFAGLFSAVLATFSVESYKLLQPDSAQTSVAILAQISQQLNSFSLNPSFVNSSQQAIPQLLTPFEPSRAAVLINVFWFLSLAFSLATASLAMLVKQWFRAYLSNENTSPEARARIRYFRHRSLLQWNVFEIAGILPSLLQFALALFFIALSIFLHTFHRAVWIAVTIAIGLWFAFYGFVISGPVFASSCPYRSPSLNALVDSLRHNIHRFIRKLAADFLPTRMIPSETVQEKEVRTRTEHDGVIWDDAEKVFFDDQFVKNTIHVCLERAQGPDVLHCVQDMLERRALRNEPQNFADHGHDSVSLALVNALVQGIEPQSGTSDPLHFHEWMAQAYCLLADGQRYCSSNGVVHMEDFIFAAMKQEWPVAIKLMRYRHTVSLATFIDVFRSRQLQRESPEDNKQVIKNLILATKDLLAYGELYDECQPTPVGPGNPSMLDFPSIINALLACIRFVPRDPSLDRSSHPPLMEDLWATVDLTISVSQRWILRDDYEAPSDYTENSGWKTALLRYKAILSGGFKTLPEHWKLAFEELHKSTLEKW